MKVVNELDQTEKELIISCLACSLADTEQKQVHQVLAPLYDELRHEWLQDPNSFHTAKEIKKIVSGS